MILASAEISSLLHQWEIAEYVSEAFVIVGCVGELIADFFKRIPERIRGHIGTSSTVVLILALTFGLKCLVKTNELSGEVIGSLGDRAAEASGKAERALSNSQEADVDSTAALSRASTALNASGKANREAVTTEIHLTAAVERTTRLEAQLSWRRITPEQKQKLRRALSLSTKLLMPLSGLRIRITYLSSAPEAQEYADELKDALNGLGGEISDPTGAVVIGPTVPQGVTMTANPLRNPRANSLITALNRAGIVVSGTRDEKMDEHDISILVGVKPREQSP